VRASLLGHGAVKALLDGHKGVMVGLVNDKIEYTTFDLACSRHNEINKSWYDIARILSI
jgi:6-phosphofructokinase 1